MSVENILKIGISTVHNLHSHIIVAASINQHSVISFLALNQVVITGSYNWTRNAEFKNDENITIERDPDQATRYSEEFRKLTC